jgi:serum/glucocorticoid-regulated kinase 2
VTRQYSKLSQVMTAEQFNNYYSERNMKKLEESKNTVTILSSDGKQLTENDFEIIKVLGRGAFGKVILTQKKDDGELYAVKIMNKGDVIEKNQIEQIKTEKDILEKVRHPFLVGLEYCFHSPSRIYFVMKFMQGGELFQHLKKVKRFSEAE